MTMLVCVNSVAVGAQHVAFIYLGLKPMQRDFCVLAYIKQFFTAHMIKV